MSATLSDVKKALGVTGNYQDDTLQIYFDEVVAFLKDSGIPEPDLAQNQDFQIFGIGFSQKKAENHLKKLK